MNTQTHAYVAATCRNIAHLMHRAEALTTVGAAYTVASGGGIGTPLERLVRLLVGRLGREGTYVTSRIEQAVATISHERITGQTGPAHQRLQEAHASMSRLEKELGEDLIGLLTLGGLPSTGQFSRPLFTMAETLLEGYFAHGVVYHAEIALEMGEEAADLVVEAMKGHLEHALPGAFEIYTAAPLPPREALQAYKGLLANPPADPLTACDTLAQAAVNIVLALEHY